jgi:hypothetical protein
LARSTLIVSRQARVLSQPDEFLISMKEDRDGPETVLWACWRTRVPEDCRLAELLALTRPPLERHL